MAIQTGHIKGRHPFLYHREKTIKLIVHVCYLHTLLGISVLAPWKSKSSTTAVCLCWLAMDNAVAPFCIIET